MSFFAQTMNSGELPPSLNRSEPIVTPFSYASLIKDSEFKSIDERLNPPKNLKAILVPVVANVSFLLNALNIDSLVFSSAHATAKPEAPH